MPYRMGGGAGSTVIAGGLLLRGEPDGNFVAVDAKTGEVLWKFQMGFGADAPPMVYEVDGDEYLTLTTSGDSIQGPHLGFGEEGCRGHTDLFAACPRLCSRLDAPPQSA